MQLCKVCVEGMFLLFHCFGLCSGKICYCVTKIFNSYIDIILRLEWSKISVSIESLPWKRRRPAGWECLLPSVRWPDIRRRRWTLYRWFPREQSLCRPDKRTLPGQRANAGQASRIQTGCSSPIAKDATISEERKRKGHFYYTFIHSAAVFAH